MENKKDWIQAYAKHNKCSIIEAHEVYKSNLLTLQALKGYEHLSVLKDIMVEYPMKLELKQ